MLGKMPRGKPDGLPPSSDKKLYGYSASVWMRIGFTRANADLLRLEKVDYPKVKWMLEHGCTHDQVLRIML